jgi:hypothetical protein
MRGIVRDMQLIKLHEMLHKRSNNLLHKRSIQSVRNTNVGVLTCRRRTMQYVKKFFRFILL